MKLAYYSRKENKFHEKSYSKFEEDKCKKDFSYIRKKGTQFFFTTESPYFKGEKQTYHYGLSFGKKIPLSKVREDAAKKIKSEVRNKVRFSLVESVCTVYESKNWYGVMIDDGEEMLDSFFITKDGGSIVYR